MLFPTENEASLTLQPIDKLYPALSDHRRNVHVYNTRLNTYAISHEKLKDIVIIAVVHSFSPNSFTQSLSLYHLHLINLIPAQWPLTCTVIMFFRRKSCVTEEGGARHGPGPLQHTGEKNEPIFSDV